MRKHFKWILPCVLPAQLFGQQPADIANKPLISPTKPLPAAFNEREMANLITRVDLGLTALAKLQNKDGSFRTDYEYAKPAVTSLSIMAFLSRGHKPGEGPYGELIKRAVDYVLTTQKESGLFSNKEINFPLLDVSPPATYDYHQYYGEGGFAKSYSHAICMLMLGEVFGLTDPQSAFRIRGAIEKGLKCTIQLWDIRQGDAREDGGFRYFRYYFDGGEADLSVTGWHAASFRSLSNAGFDIPKKAMERIANYVIRNQNPDGTYTYYHRRYVKPSHAMTAAGVLCLALAGKHDHPTLENSCRYLLRFDAANPQSFASHIGKYFPYYTCYYLTQASIQMGGQFWTHCMKECYKALIARQDKSGLWIPEGFTRPYGDVYSTSMAIISLTPPLQLLPIYQR